MGSKEYTNERVPGHRVSAKIERDMTFAGKFKKNVLIKEGDVVWQKGRKVRLTLDELQEIAEMFCDE